MLTDTKLRAQAPNARTPSMPRSRSRLSNQPAASSNSRHKEAPSHPRATATLIQEDSR